MVYKDRFRVVSSGQWRDHGRWSMEYLEVDMLIVGPQPLLCSCHA
jgi:hypothetical protein